MAEKDKTREARAEYMRQYNTTPERREKKRQYNATPEAIEKARQRKNTPERIEYQRQYNATPEVREKKRQYDAIPEVREKRRQRKGLPTPTRPEPSACECCGKPKGKRAFALEHCHVTGVFRGWLCGKCNRGLGLFGDSIEGLMNAVRYLQRAQQ